MGTESECSDCNYIILLYKYRMNWILTRTTSWKTRTHIFIYETCSKERVMWMQFSLFHLFYARMYKTILCLWHKSRVSSLSVFTLFLWLTRVIYTSSYSSYTNMVITVMGWVSFGLQMLTNNNNNEKTPVIIIQELTTDKNVFGRKYIKYL